MMHGRENIKEQIMVGRQPQNNTVDAVTWRIFKVTRAVGATKLIEPIFFSDVISSERYVGQIHNFSKIRVARRLNTHSACKTMELHTQPIIEWPPSRNIFGGRLISRSLWPACSPDPTPCGDLSITTFIDPLHSHRGWYWVNYLAPNVGNF